jgi:hypothetical protein
MNWSYRNVSDAARWVVWGGGLALMATSQAYAARTADGHGNEGYSTAAECDAAVNAGTAKFYESFTQAPPLKKPGEADVKVMRLGELPGYERGACDLGTGRRNNRDGVAGPLIGKWVPFSPQMSVNVYYDAQGTAVRATMQVCDNNFQGDFPRPVGEAAQAASTGECYAYVMTPAKFETKTEQVVKVPATKRYEAVAPSFKTETDQVLVSPEMKRQIPVPATYKEVSEQVLVRPESFREEPIPATFKNVTEEVLVRPESKRYEVVPGTFKTVTEQVLATPERKELKVIPAVYGEQEETIVDKPATTRVETIPATFKTVAEQVLVRPESLRYEAIDIPLKTITEEMLSREASERLVASKSTLKTVTDQVLVRAESRRLIEVPAVYETVTDRYKVSETYRTWKRGRAYLGRAIDVRPLRGFVVGADGTVDGAKVDLGTVAADNARLDDDVMCLVEIPATYETVTRQVIKTPATVREEIIPAQYGTVSRQELEQQAATSSETLPAQYRTVTRRVIDIEKLKGLGYQFDDKGDIVAAPDGSRVLRAANVAALVEKGGDAAAAAAAAGKTEGAQSGKEGYVKEVRIPAQYRTVNVQVLDQPANVRTVEVPATYKTVKRTVVTAPARTEEIVTPAVYKTVSREVVDQAPSTREIPIPPVYKTITKQVVDTPASTRKIPVPAVYETVTRRVVDTPATFREEVIPAVYKTVSRQVIAVPASVREIEVPAQYETINYRVKVSEGKLEQRAILCETNATQDKIKQIQQALADAGFDPGPVDGQMRTLTMRAVNAYQQSKGLPVDGYLNLETVKALGVNAN